MTRIGRRHPQGETIDDRRDENALLITRDGGEVIDQSSF
jgi:hypothetical protein